jgi:tetratricopeptide (TPR) repeat protein
MDDEIKRWTAKRKTALVMDIIEGRTTVAEASRAFDLTAAEIESWLEDGRKGIANALDANPLNFREQFERLLKGIQAGLDSSASLFKAFAINAAFILTFGVMIPMILIELTAKRTIIEPIGVPEDIAALGLTSDVVANRLWDGLTDTAAAARTDKRKLAVLPTSQRIEFEFPDSGVSFNSLIHHVRRFLGWEDMRIGGELVCPAAPCTRETMSLRLRIVTDRTVAIDLPPVGDLSDRDYFRVAALAALKEIDPFTAAAAQVDRAPADAMASLRRIAASGHADAEWAYNLIGLALLGQDRPEEAKRAFEAALALDPRHLPALINLSLLHSRMGDADAAEAAAVRAARIAPRDLRIWMARAEAAFVRGEAEAAIGHLDRAAAADQAAPWPLVRKALALADGDPEAAAAAYRSALDRDPDFTDAHVGLAALALGRGDYAEALARYLEIVRIEPDDPQAHRAAGRLHVILRQSAEAVAAYRRALELAPGQASVLHEMGQLLRDTGDLAGAEVALAEAAQIVPAALYDLGDTLQRAGQPERARDAYVRFLATQTDSPYRALAEAQLRRLATP